MPISQGSNWMYDTAAAAAFDIDNSCRFDNTNTSIPDSLYWDNSGNTATNEKIFTLSFWVKMTPNPTLESGSANNMILVGSQESGGDGESINMTRNSAGDATLNFKLNWLEEGVGHTNATARQFRDHSAWYHLMFVTDTTDGTAGDRQRFYVNGVRETFTGYNYSQNATPRSFNGGIHRIGSGGVNNSQNNRGYQGYMAEMHFVDGTAQAVGDFGETDSDSGIWKPKKTSGITYGTNGWYLDFAASGSMGNDVSGNNNDFTLIGIDATNQTTDTPTNNFATVNALDHADTLMVFTEGNLRVKGEHVSTSTFWISRGKWYFEWKITDLASGYGYQTWWGLMSYKYPTQAFGTSGSEGVWAYQDPLATVGSPKTMAFRIYPQTGGCFKNANNGASNNEFMSGQDFTMQEGCVVRICIDYDNGAAWQGIWEGEPNASNGAYIGGDGTENDGHGWWNYHPVAASSNPATGRWPAIGRGSAGTSYTRSVTTQDGTQSDLDLRDVVPGPVRIFQSTAITNAESKLNYGNPTYTWSGSSYTDDNGYGKFQYEPPSGFYALCSKNLAEFG